MTWLSQLDYWHWFILAVVLMTLEVFSPGAFLLWMGLSAGITGIVLLLFPELGWQFQLLSFALFSVATIVVARTFLRHRPIETDSPHLNRRGEQYIERIFSLQEPIINGEGKIKVDDSTWKIHGEDCPTGTKVKVVGVQGVVLLVKQFD
ncbi:MAG: NfeD family protein [Candidatus Thiodiazotropha sp. L084R]